MKKLTGAALAIRREWIEDALMLVGRLAPEEVPTGAEILRGLRILNYYYESKSTVIQPIWLALQYKALLNIPDSAVAPLILEPQGTTE